MSGVPPSPVKRWVINEFCRICYEPLAFVWFRPELYEFHVNVIHKHGPYCKDCGKCKCGMQIGWTQPPSAYTPI